MFLLQILWTLLREIREDKSALSVDRQQQLHAYFGRTERIRNGSGSGVQQSGVKEYGTDGSESERESRESDRSVDGVSVSVIGKSLDSFSGGTSHCLLDYST